jgi:SAM-dependent methyltransferase
MTAPSLDKAEPKRCDYEGKDYEGDFWQGTGREYEDAVERIALNKLLPARADWMIEIGAGYGRLASLYRPRYNNVVLLDYSPTLVEKAARKWQGANNIRFVVGDLYNLPFAGGLFDVGVMVRVLHHVENVGMAFGEIRRIMHPGSQYVLEYPNKRHLKTVIRHLLHRPGADPFSLSPVKLDDLYFNYHPAYVETALKRAGFRLEDELAVSFFRLGALKRAVGPRLLAHIDGQLQEGMAKWKLTPSIFLKTTAIETLAPAARPDNIWRCPSCHEAALTEFEDSLECPSCGTKYEKRNGVYYFR